MQNTKSFFKSRNFIILFLSIYGESSCTKYIGENITVKPKTFKIQVPLAENKNGFVINTAWGKNKTAHLLNWDNHSPTWGNNSIILNNPSVTKSNEYRYRTLTADGTYIHGDVYECKEITFGNVSFENVLFYNIDEQTSKDKTAKTEGVFGEDLIAKGAWKFDFKKQAITFASCIDSIDSLSRAILIPSVFKDNTIQLKVKFRNDIVLPVEIDFGYSGNIILPENEFEKIAVGNSRMYQDSTRFSTPTNSQRVEQKVGWDSISINDNFIQTYFSTNPLVKDALIGRRFFQQYEFVIFDYLNKSVYVSKNRAIQ